MSFLLGSTKEMSPADVQAFRKNLFGFLQNTGFGTVLHGADQGPDIAPYRAQFAQRRAEALAQAKEQAGNLTGSGFGNIFGAAAGRSVTEENAFLANLQEQARQASAQRFLQLIGAAPGFVGQMGYQPGFLDYLFQGAEAAAPFAAPFLAKKTGQPASTGGTP